MDVEHFLKEFQDYLAPKLDTYEQAIYLYIFRHSRLLGHDEVTIGFRSARTRMAMGIGKAGTPMAEGRCREKLKSLAEKGCVDIRGTVHNGTRIHLKLPNEIQGVISLEEEPTAISVEEMDFFEVSENRQMILEREEHKCFYCLRKLNNENLVIEHVVSRPSGDNSYRNVVAACRDCNNRKGNSQAQEFLRALYRDGFLSTEEFEDRSLHLEKLREGKLRPNL